MLHLNQVRLRRGDRVLFDQASLQAQVGQRIGVTGANGAGKTSLFELIAGRLEPDAGAVVLQPDCRIATVEQQAPATPGNALQFVLDGDAELRAAETALHATEAGGEPSALAAAWERYENAGGYSAEARAGRLLHALGFEDEQLGQPVSSFSGGWRVRLALARALMCRSDLLLLDEPTNHLDLPAILWLEKELGRYPGLLLIISHDRDFLDAVCNRIAHIEGQRLTLYGGNYSQFEAARSAQLAEQQSLYTKQQKEIAHVQSFVDRFRYKASKARQAQSRLKMLERMTRIAPAHVDSPFRFAFLQPRRQPAHLLQLEDADLGYADGSPILSVDKLGLQAGQRLGLLGVNGAGKSTLVRALADGTTMLAGRRVVHRDTVIGYFAQHQFEQLDPQLSPLQHLQRHEPDAPEQDMRNYLGGFGFVGDRIFDPVAPFSGGEKARLVLALLIRLQPNLLLLDEPTNHLDLEMRQALGMALTDYPGALVVIAHDRHLLRTVCDELLIVHDGRVEWFDGSLDDYGAWLGQRATTGSTPAHPDARPKRNSPNRKSARQAGARERQALKPLTDRVRAIDAALIRTRRELDELEAELAEPALYADEARRDERDRLIRQQAEMRRNLHALEEDWLQAGAALEAAGGTAP